MFLDEVIINVRSGTGGNGVVHFRREKYVPKGGPDGGDGGKGGDIILVADEHHNTLIECISHPRYKASNGGHGAKNHRCG